MSLDVMHFLRDEFLHKYEKLKNSRSSIDAPLTKIFREYEALLKGIDIACLQGANKDLLYVLNCAVDDCLVESAESLHSMAKRSFRRCKQRGSLENLKKLEQELPNLIFTISSHCGSSVSAPHKPASIPHLKYVVHGFQDQFDEIVKKISISSEEGSSQPAVGIVGIGGSGKTTLASMVFNSREVSEKYQIMIWASLTSTLNKKESSRGSVFREILAGAQNNNNLKTMLKKVEYYQGGLKMADHVLDKYVEHFKETLKRNSGKYLIVLDDVWETEYWFAEKEEGSEAKCILSREWIEKTGGTVVVTSRLEEMAENIVGKKNLYMMLPVENEPCFEIFLDRATKDGHFNREDEQLRKLKKDIEDMCYGLPLAACTVADIIVAKKDKEEEAKKEMDAAKAKAEQASASKAEGEEDGSKVKAETEGEAGGSAKAEASASKAEEAGGEADGSKVKAETEGEAGGPKAEEEEEEEEAGGSEAEGDTAAAKMEAEAALKAESEREADALKAKTEAAAGDSKAEGEADALEGKGKAETDALKAEREGGVSKAQEEAVLSGGTGEGTQGELEKEQK